MKDQLPPPPPPTEASVLPRTRGSTRRLTQQLVDDAVKRAQHNSEKQSLSDGGSLYLRIRTPGGQATYIQHVTVQGRKTEFRIGAHPYVTLEAARVQGWDAKVLAARGIDPTQERQNRQAAMTKAAQRQDELQLRAVAAKFIEEYTPDWAEHTLKSKLRRIANYLEDKPFWRQAIDSIDVQEVLVAIKKVAESHQDTAMKLFQEIKQYAQFAIDQGLIAQTPLATMKLPRILRRYGEEIGRGLHHHPALLELDALGRVLRDNENSSACWQCVQATRLCFLTVQRSGPVCAMRWEHIDFERREWRIPRAEMKVGERKVERQAGSQARQTEQDPFIVKLCRQALDMLTSIPRRGPWVFPAPTNEHQHLHQTVLEKHYREGLKLRDIHRPHSNRASFSTWANKEMVSSDGRHTLKFDKTVIKMCLDHEFQSKVEGAYNRELLLVLMAELLQDWADALEIAQQNARQNSGQEPGERRLRK